MWPLINDHLAFSKNKWIVNNEDVFFSGEVSKYNSLGVMQIWALILTNMAVYNIKEMTQI